MQLINKTSVLKFNRSSRSFQVLQGATPQSPGRPSAVGRATHRYNASGHHEMRSQGEGGQSDNMQVNTL